MGSHPLVRKSASARQQHSVSPPAASFGKENTKKCSTQEILVNIFTYSKQVGWEKSVKNSQH